MNPTESTADTNDVQMESIISGLKTATPAKSNVWNNLIFLAITIVLFFSTGLITAQPLDILILIGVILLHELGHFAAMKIFKYNDVKMFFIPFLGAAVSGTNITVCQYKKAIVSLLGPLPGIVLAVVLVYTGDCYNPHYFTVITTLLMLNIFNLLPFSPLDGGRYFESLYFHNRYLQLAFSVLGILFLAVISLQLRAYAILLFIIIDIMVVKNHFNLGGIAQDYRREGVSAASVEELLHDKQDLAKRILSGIRNKFPKLFSPNVQHTIIRSHMTVVLEKMNTVPPKMFTRIFYTLAYLMIMAVSLVFAAVIAIMQPRADVDLVNKRFVKNIFGRPVSEYAIDSKGYYNGNAYHYEYNMTNRYVEKAMQFSNGVLHGETIIYATNEKPVIRMQFRNGELMVQSNLVENVWQESRSNDAAVIMSLKQCNGRNVMQYVTNTDRKE